MDNIKVSICMPTRNRAGFIGQALESIISQADDSIEIVIVDGASQDNTQEIVQAYQKKFKNLVYSRQDENGGVDRDMAKAITLSRGEYCWLFSDDDLFKPGAIKRILTEIKSGDEIYLCNITACNLLMQPYKEMFWLSRTVQDKVFNLHDRNEFIEYCNKANSIGALFSYWSSIILRREEWVKSGYDCDFDKTAYALAASLFSFIKRKCRLKYIKDSLVCWRNDNESFQHEGGLVKRFLLDFNGYLKIADKYLSADPAMRNSFLRVMKREHPWYTIIHAASFIDGLTMREQFSAKLLKFGYNKKMIGIYYLLGRYKNLVSFGVKIKRKIARSNLLNKMADLPCNATSNIRKQALKTIPLFNYLLVFNIFAGAFTVFRSPFEFYLGYVFILSFLAVYIYCFHSLRINYNFILMLSILTILSLINVYLGNNTVFLLAKQVSGILITGIAYYILVKMNNYKMDKLFKIYLRIALVVAAIGIFQEISFLIGFRIGYDFSWMPMLGKWNYATTTIGILRINSIFMEPAHFAISMAPAFFVSMVGVLEKNNLPLKSKWRSIIILVSYILSCSVVAYIAVLISILIFVSSKGLRHLLLLAIIIPVFVFTAYWLLPDIRMRVDESIVVISKLQMPRDTHLSVYSIVSNSFVALKSFMNNPLFGHGLGSHPLSYDNFIHSGAPWGFWQSNYPEVNKGDASALFLRLLSETGLFGIIVVFYFIFRFRLKMNNSNNLQIISNAIFILLILHVLRQGHYFYNGLFFFVWVYYFAYKVFSKPAIKDVVAG